MKHVPLLLVAIIYLAYISLGLPDGIFGVAWPGIRLDIKLPLEYAGIITTLLIICSATSSFFSGAVVQRIGTGKLILFSCFLTASALFGYSIMPSALWIFIFALPLGLGQGAVDSGLNHYVANNLSSRHMNWLHCCWGIGAATGPFIFSAL
ncbi:MAG TPA: MFS transporter, partial [Spirochaetota bacterium]|nr:MFS transporter [Spirochaetota bacterium]